MARLIGLLAIPLLLSACLQTDSNPGTTLPSEDQVRDRFPWAFSDCVEIVAVFQVPNAALASVLPGGFEPLGDARAGQMTTVGIDIFECGSGVGALGNVSNPSYSSFWALVKAPAELMGEAEAAYVKWDTLVPDPTTYDVLKAVDASVRNGTTSIRVATPGLAGTVGTIEFEDSETWTVTIVPGTPPGTAGQPSLLREFSPAGPDGNDVVLWETTLIQSNQSNAPGLIEVPQKSMPARLFGSSRIPCTVSLGDGELREGFIQMHARNATR